MPIWLIRKKDFFYYDRIDISEGIDVNKKQANQKRGTFVTFGIS